MGITGAVPSGPGNSEGTIWVLWSQKVQGEGEGRLGKGEEREML